MRGSARPDPTPGPLPPGLPLAACSGGQGAGAAQGNGRQVAAAATAGEALRASVGCGRVGKPGSVFLRECQGTVWAGGWVSLPGGLSLLW